MATDKKYTERNFTNRGLGDTNAEGEYVVEKGKGLATTLPKPNILRIEVLDGNARERYLSSVQRVGDQVRRSLYQRISQDGERVFYGFLVGGGETEFDLSIEWNDRSADATLLGELKGIVAGTSGLVSGAMDIVDKVGEIGSQLLGVNKSATGSATVKNFSGVSLNDYSITCGWYLPEQYHLCVKSLKTLYRMAYPKQIGDFGLANIIKDVGQGLQQIQVGDGLIADTSEKVASTVGEAVNQSEIPQKMFNGYKDIQEAFGRNFTFNPLPVRVCVGQHMDVEPLVITGVSTKFSKETFINYSGSKNDIGRHLPIFVTTTISFKYWLNPAPNLQFTSLLGEELFGEDPIPAKSVNTYSTGTYDPNGKTVQDVIEENNMTRSYMDNTITNIGRYGNSPLKPY